MAQTFIDALLGASLPLIAEIKPRSAQGEDLLRGRSVAEIVSRYLAIGAPCLSVVTGSWFGGDPALLRQVARHAGRPVLRKDFITREAQLVETRDMGAAAVLLTAAILPRPALRRLASASLELGLTPFIEVASVAELDGLVLDADCIVAVNNKDIRRRETDPGDIGRSLDLLPAVRSTGTACPVSASGIGDAATAACLLGAGFKGLLVGSALLRAADLRAWASSAGRRLDAGMAVS